MPQITAWQCPHTGQLFAYRADYVKHLENLAKQRRKARRRAAEAIEIRESMSGLYQCGTFDELCEWFLENGSVVATHSIFIRYGKIVQFPKFRFTRFQMAGIHWDKNCCNYHSAPMGKPTNWGNRDKSLPTGYPGWSINPFTYTVVGDDDYSRTISDYFSASGRDIFAKTGLNTGTGGGGRDGEYYYDAQMFEDDFPVIAVLARFERLDKKSA